jgi:hypothetical protein
LWAIGQSALLKQTDGLNWKKIDSLIPGGLPVGATPPRGTASVPAPADNSRQRAN